MNHNIWLRGCKPRVFKKYNWRVGIDGCYYRPKDYTKLVAKHKAVKVGDYIFNPYRSIWEKVKEIDSEWLAVTNTDSPRHKNMRYLEITFITETNNIVYDLNDYKHYFEEDPNIPPPPLELGVCHF